MLLKIISLLSIRSMKTSLLTIDGKKVLSLIGLLFDYFVKFSIKELDPKSKLPLTNLTSFDFKIVALDSYKGSLKNWLCIANIIEKKRVEKII